MYRSGIYIQYYHRYRGATLGGYGVEPSTIKNTFLYVTLRVWSLQLIEGVRKVISCSFYSSK